MRERERERNEVWLRDPLTLGFQGSTVHLGPSVSVSFFTFIFCLFRATPTAQRAPRLGVESELQLLAYATATARPDPTHSCDLHHSSRQCQSLNPLSKAGIEPATSWILVRFITVEPQQELLKMKSSSKVLSFLLWSLIKGTRTYVGVGKKEDVHFNFSHQIICPFPTYFQCSSVISKIFVYGRACF